MRKIEDLLVQNKRIWFFLSDDDSKKEFIYETEIIGSKFSNGDSITVNNCGQIMAMCHKKELRYVSMMVWIHSFYVNNFDKQNDFINKYNIPIFDFSNIIKINYKKYIAGDEDYVIAKNPFSLIIRPSDLSN